MTHMRCQTCGEEHPLGQLTIPFDGRPDGGPFCGRCLLALWRNELVVTLIVRKMLLDWWGR